MMSYDTSLSVHRCYRRSRLSACLSVVAILFFLLVLFGSCGPQCWAPRPIWWALCPVVFGGDPLASGPAGTLLGKEATSHETALPLPLTDSDFVLTCLDLHRNY